MVEVLVRGIAQVSCPEMHSLSPWKHHHVSWVCHMGLTWLLRGLWTQEALAAMALRAVKVGGGGLCTNLGLKNHGNENPPHHSVPDLQTVSGGDSDGPPTEGSGRRSLEKA